MKILVLGHKGMLGRSVFRHFSSLPEYEVVTLTSRWGDVLFSEEILAIGPNFIINCIGKIPQKNPIEAEYEHLNVALPRFLETLGIKVIHPSTDCEFKGDIPPGEAYTKQSIRDARDVYGLSKASISREIEESFSNTKIIRTSIIGHEESTSLSLLDWFLSQTGGVRGYTNHFWNGITTLEWAKQCQILIQNWESHPVLNQLGTAVHYSKFEIVSLAKEIYEKDIEITPFATDITVNKCLVSDKTLPELDTQLSELRSFFKK
jgi:dTDP-4-dehydrorhamnose reductase